MLALSGVQMAHLMELGIGPVQIFLGKAVGERFQYGIHIITLGQTFFGKRQFTGLNLFSMLRKRANHRHLVA